MVGFSIYKKFLEKGFIKKNANNNEENSRPVNHSLLFSHTLAL